MEEIKNRIKQYLFFIKGYSSIIQTLFLVIQVIGYIIFNSIYKTSAENYFKIPKEYFQIDISNYILIVTLIFVVVIYGYSIYKYFDESKYKNIEYKFNVGVLSFVLTIIYISL